MPKIATAETCLANLQPEIAQEWHPSKNNTLTPQDVTPGSGQKVWWLCPQGHDYEAAIASRTNPNKLQGCPYCSGQRVHPDNCLATRYPEIADQWHPDKNGTLTPQDVTARTPRKVWWLCPQGHDYEAQIANRTNPNNPTGCPYCSGKRVNAENCLATLHPEIADQWHPSKNTFTPQEVTANSGQKVWWLCPQGHDYEAVIGDRTPPNPSGCPYCSGRRATAETCLANCYPEIADQWHPSKNDDLTPRDVTAKSGKKVWWHCPQGHEWEALIYSRTPPQSQGCPYCSGRRATPETCLARLQPEIAQEWHPDKNGALTPQEVTAGTPRKVWWLCARGHDYEAAIGERTNPNKSRSCPYCAGKRVNEENCLATRYPEIADQWHPSKNTFTPQEVTPGSHTKVWWLCPKGHDYEAVVNSRTPPHSTGCPFCTRQSSSQEYRLLAELEFILGQDEVRHRDKSLGKEVDLYLPCYRIAIEYDGSYYHQDKEEQDKAKRDHLHEQGVTLIRLRHQLKKLSSHDIIHQSSDITKEDIDDLLAVLGQLAHLRDAHQEAIQAYEGHSDFCNEDGYRDYLARLPAPPENESLPYLYPDIAREWHPELNGTLTPQNFPAKSGEKVWWQCPQGHDYEARIAHRTRQPNPTGCPYCAGKRVNAENCLATRYPEIAQEWHPHLNGDRTPQDVTANSGQKVWWRCPQGHDYEAAIGNRTPPKLQGCPYCAGNRVHHDNCLATLHPEIATQWHPQLNGDRTPQDVTANSGQKVWWLCPKGHDYEAVIANRTPPDPSGCPVCAGRQVHQDNCLANCYPEIADQWHPSKNDDLTPQDVTAGTPRKVWWLCPKGHDYEARIASRTKPNKPTGCPYCAGKRVNEENCLANLHPEIAAQWHPTKNDELTPQDVTAGTSRKVWWHCPQGHDYEAKVNNRTPPKLQGCPYCVGQRVNAENCLATRYPEIADQWHPDKNGALTPQDVMAKTGQKVWWLCPKGHDYKARIADRTPPKPQGCPYCAGKKVNAENCLANLHPEIADQWHPDKNGELTPQDVTTGTRRKVWWRCPQGHEWEALIYSRTPPDPRGCPICARARRAKQAPGDDGSAKKDLAKPLAAPPAAKPPAPSP